LYVSAKLCWNLLLQLSFYSLPLLFPVQLASLSHSAYREWEAQRFLVSLARELCKFKIFYFYAYQYINVLNVPDGLTVSQNYKTKEYFSHEQTTKQS